MRLAYRKSNIYDTMAQLHESQISKTNKIIGYVLTILPTLLIISAGIGKIFGIEATLENMSKVPNFEDLIVFIGVLELVIMALYWFPKTKRLGFFLLCSFCGGIIVAEMVSGQIPVMGIVISVMFYIGTFVRMPSLLK